jgi:hypothetical protein
VPNPAPFQRAPSYTGRTGTGHPNRWRLQHAQPPPVIDDVHQPRRALPYGLPRIRLGETHALWTGTLQVRLSVERVANPPPGQQNIVEIRDETLKCEEPHFLLSYCSQFRQDNANPTSVPVPDDPNRGVWGVKSRRVGNPKRREEAERYNYRWYYHIEVDHPPPLTLTSPEWAEFDIQDVNLRIPSINVVLSQVGEPKYFKGAQQVGDSYLGRYYTHPLFQVPGRPPLVTTQTLELHNIELCWGGQSALEFSYLAHNLQPVQIADFIVIHVGIIDACRHRLPTEICEDLREGVTRLLQHEHVRGILLATLPIIPQFEEGNDPRGKLVKLVNKEIRYRLGIRDPRLQIFKYDHLYTDSKGSGRKTVRRFFEEYAGNGNPDLLHLTQNAYFAFDGLLNLYKQEYFPGVDLARIDTL